MRVRACYSTDALIWHNTDGVAQSVDENLRVLGWIARNVKDFRYEDVRYQPTATGFVEQHVTCGTSPGGTPFAIPACIVCTVVDGLVTRVDEYLDSAQAAGIASVRLTVSRTNGLRRTNLSPAARRGRAA